ncbi:GntR family transcriptional regulator [Gluconacetobacter sacchari DSM 12717]|uniref:PLP-dependent aminotransferase family protein n=2 Tax=Gluconacetobacter sacchari TaxID=92759 RepID=A0A7W4I9Q8_9PROT|nr:PLP-dependent aminotransferase family protein [Gluconacetobacter sacchari]MBB2158840.1 PLP-dependent aminotransferase family protein [Gluconacetobacter sacchari]GBQ21196.1 GntR family transcriptional regulator [Gluconacetobacter sacchari DSM 12717]
MTPFLPSLDRGADDNLQEQIVRQFIAAIVAGALRPGQRLLSVRESAARWRVSRNTVVLAYERLGAEGYIEPRSSSGTFVHRMPPGARRAIATPSAGLEAGESLRPRPADSLFDQAFVDDRRHGSSQSVALSLGFGSNVPLYRAREWRRVVQRLLVHDGWKGGGQFQPNAGLPFLRDMLARWLTARHGLPVDARQVIVVAGLQQAHSIIARALSRHDRAVMLEDPCYVGKRRLYEACGAGIRPVPVDEHGISLHDAAFEGVGLAVVNPGCHVPLGVTLPLARRRQLLAAARAAGALLVEESMYDLLSLDDDLPSLLALAGGQGVIHAGLFAPTLGGGVMLGYLVVPWAELQAVLETKLLMDNGLPWLEQEALARLIDTGELDQILRRTRTVMMRRRQAVLDAQRRHLGEVTHVGIGKAPRMSWLLPSRWPDTATFVARGAQAGIYVPGRYPLVPESGRKSLISGRIISHGYGEVDDGEIDRVFALLAGL